MAKSRAVADRRAQGRPAKAFPRFPKLPLELRTMIWKAAIGPKVITFRQAPGLTDQRCSVSVQRQSGALLQTCGESRVVVRQLEEAQSLVSLPGLGGYVLKVDWELDTIHFDVTDSTMRQVFWRSSLFQKNIQHLAYSSLVMSGLFHNLSEATCRFKNLKTVTCERSVTATRQDEARRLKYFESDYVWERHLLGETREEPKTQLLPQTKMKKFIELGGWNGNKRPYADGGA